MRFSRTAVFSEKRVLIIEDDALQYRVAAQHLSRARGTRFAVEWAPNFEEGCRRLLESRYDLCLLDYQLGDRDGLELLRRVRAEGCFTPVIFLTADASEEVDHAAMEAGAADFLVKGEINARMLERSMRYALKLEETMAELRLRATHDPLTGLLNRREFERLLAQECDRAARFGHVFAVAMLDLDHFKSVNDRFGHPAGDSVLRVSAQRMMAALRSVDVLARIGGEEMGALIIESDALAARQAIDRLVTAVGADPFPLEQGGPLSVTISAGLAFFPADGRSAGELVASADRMLYESKRAGRNRVTQTART